MKSLKSIQSLLGPIVLVFSTIVLTSCQPQTTNSDVNSDVNKDRSDCVKNYDPNVDYFPNKAKIQDATGFTIEYHKNYKTISVTNPWKDAKVRFKYVLVQCGTPTPSGFEADQIVQIPVRSVIALSTTHLVQLEKIGVIDRLIAVSDFKFITTPSVLKKIKQNQIVEVGSPSTPNVEKILSLAPDLVTSYGTGSPQSDGYAKLVEAGLRVGLVSEYMEPTPLGRAEWIKFLALFFNKEAESEKAYSEVASRYKQLANKSKEVKTKPTVFSGFSSKGIWYVPGGKSYVAELLKDAGANYIWSNDRTTGSLNLSAEEVYDRAKNAEYWLNGSQSWKTRSDVIQADSRYQDFLAVKQSNLYSPINRVNSEMGNDYWQSGVANPDLILADLIKIFHPNLMNDYQFYYYKKLP